ncbi:tetratricopeptide repeat protein [Candidatus Desantisbacteria bacterium]|nr:tetratricopeptide repeat protein [Candidatus Desantisbacteria bacterium]
MKKEILIMKIILLTLIYLLLTGCSKGAENAGDEAPISGSGGIPQSQIPQPDNSEIENAKMRISEYEKILENEPGNVQYRLNLATAYYFLKEYNKAIDNFIKILGIDAKNMPALISLGNIYYDMKMHNKAIDYYKKALELDPDNLDVRCDMGTSYKELGMYDVAINEYKKNIKINPDHLNTRYNLSVVLTLSGHTKEAARERSIYDSLASFQRQ